MPQVSIIIPAYNRMPVLLRAVQSVLSQTYKDRELIVVDDGSTDDTRKVMPSLPLNYIRQPHLGAAVARNRGIDEARGKYIAFLDSDDEFLPGKLEKQVAVMESFPHPILSHTSYIRSREGFRVVVKSGRYGGHKYPRILFNCPVAMPTVMARAESLKKYKFIEGIHGNDDTILWSKLARLGLIVGIDEPLTIISVGNATSAFNREHQLISIENIIEYGIRRDENLSLIDKAFLTSYWNLIRLRLKANV